MFQKSGLFGCFCGRHRGRQVDQPLRIRGKPAHDFKSRERVFLPDRHIVMQPSCDNTLSDHIIDIEQIVVNLLRGERRRGFCDRRERFDRLCVGLTSCNRDEVLLRVEQCCQVAAEDTAGIDVNRAIQPIGLGHRSVAIDHHCLAAILRSPVVANWQAEFVSLACRLAIERKISNLS